MEVSVSFLPLEDKEKLLARRKKLYKRLTTALDGMWESLYIAQSNNVEICIDGKAAGYCCIDQHKSLNQIYLEDQYLGFMNQVILRLISTERVHKAQMSSIEPISFNACLAHSKSLEKNTLCFQFPQSKKQGTFPKKMRLAEPDDQEKVRGFYKDEVGFEDTFGYVKNVIHRGELLLLEEEGIILGTGECRLSETQIDFADLGVAVKADQRGKGLATQILKEMLGKALGQERRPICSTTIDNIGSQKAIQRAGLYLSHYIFDITF